MASLLRVSSVLIALTAGPLSAATPGPIHYWSFDDRLGDAVTGEELKAVGTPEYVPGAVNRGILFRGDSALHHTPKPLKLGAFSISVWVQSSEKKLHGRILEKGASNSFWIYATQGQIIGGFFDPVRVKYQDVPSARDICDGKWHHVAVTFSGDLLKLYVDGELENMVRYADKASIHTDNSPYVIGSKFQAPAHDNLMGAIDELKVYDRALEPSEIAAESKSTHRIPAVQ